jgi:hypothetical protein
MSNTHTSRRGTGLRVTPHRLHLLGAPHPEAAPGPITLPVALRSYWPVRLDQGRSSTCGAGGSAPAIYVALAAAGTPLPFIPSQHAIISACYAKEQPGDGPLEDTGIDVVDLIDVLARIGVEAMKPTRTPDGRCYDVWTAEDTAGLALPPGVPASNVELRPTLADDEACGRDLVLGVQRLDTGEADFAQHVAASLCEKKPVGVGIHATPYERAYEGATESTPALDDASGATESDLHWTVILDARQGPKGIEFWILTSWGAGGADGGVWVTEAWLTKMAVVALKFSCTLEAAA